LRRASPGVFGPDGQAYTAAELFTEVLAKRRHATTFRGEWVLFPELRFGTGASTNADSRVDAFAMHCWPSKRFLRVAYEIKVSRGDFLRELKDPLKRRPGLLISNQFYFLCCPGVAKAEEIPADCGLLVARKTQEPRGWLWDIREAVPALPRDEMGVSWAFVASLARRVVGGTAVVPEVAAEVPACPPACRTVSGLVIHSHCPACQAKLAERT
jgi:hypothetical protein